MIDPTTFAGSLKNVDHQRTALAPFAACGDETEASKLNPGLDSSLPPIIIPNDLRSNEFMVLRLVDWEESSLSVIHHSSNLVLASIHLMNTFDLSVSFPSQGVIRLQSRSLFGDADDPACRRFPRAQSSRPMRSRNVTIFGGDSPRAELHYCPKTHDGCRMSSGGSSASCGRAPENGEVRSNGRIHGEFSGHALGNGHAYENGYANGIGHADNNGYSDGNDRAIGQRSRE